MSTIIISLLLAALFVWIAAKIIKDKKKSGSGCPGCSGCGQKNSCSSMRTAHK